ncbi:MAG: patatin-like phospholipase family protein, partial [Treponema sp.]|nr:patatin-like phospholipase family protein [Treponema sp.]
MRFPRFIISFFLLAIGTSCNGENIGLCLSGGGAKGAYEIGVMKAIEEKNLSPNIKSISGTSVGALNGTLFASVG